MARPGAHLRPLQSRLPEALGFPRSGLLAARIACLAADEPWLPDFVRAVYRANFAEDRAIDQPSVVAEILADLGLPADELLAKAAKAEAKAALRRRTDEAVALAIFGAPTMMAGSEMFWGNDRLEDALNWAAGRRPSEAGAQGTEVS